MVKGENIRRKNIVRIIVAIILIAIIFVGITIGKKYVNRIELTQLSPQTHSQMMGYIIKTQDNKIIAIDGGTVDDTSNFVDKINTLGGKIDYWFITHPHNDHAGVFNVVISNNS